MKQKEFTVTSLPPQKQLGFIMKSLGSIADIRQQSKVRYPIADIILLVVAAIAGNAESWADIEDYGTVHAELLLEYLNIRSIPSHDTIQRVMALVNPALLQRIYLLWCTKMDFSEETPTSLRGYKLLNMDGKTMRGSAGRGKKALHVETAWDPQKGISLGQVVVPEKTNEITAIPMLLDMLDLDGYIVTLDAMGTQKAIAEKIIERGGEYLLAAKGNQQTLEEDLRECAQNEELRKELKSQGNYYRKAEKAHGQYELREYWQTDDLEWLQEKEKWAGVKTIGFERTTIKKNGKVSVSWRYFISSLPLDVELFAAAVRGHWQIEAMHNVLDVTLNEDANKTIDRTAAANLNVVRKWVLSVLRHVDIGKKRSLRSKNFYLGHDPRPALQMLKTEV